MKIDIKLLLVKAKLLPSHLLNLFVFRIMKVSYCCNIKTYGTIFIRGTGNIDIGNNVIITSCRDTDPIGGDTKTIFVTKGKGSISIGNGTGISNSSLVSYSKITIGKNVFIGAGCKIYDTDFHPIDYEDRINNNISAIKSGDVTIKDGAFIGAHSIILKGVTIGERSIIGAGSVVTKSVPNNEIWAGNPATYKRNI